MSRTQKLVLIALAVLALAFIALLVWGQTQPDCSGTEAECAQQYEPGDAMKLLGSLLSGAGPKVKLPQPRYTLPTAASSRIDIPSSKDKLRTLKLRLTQGAATLSVETAAGEPDGIDLSEQKKPTALPRAATKAEDRRTLSFALPASGGVLVVSCTIGPCVIEGR